MNKEQPHILVLPEDDANRQLANAFHLQIDWDRQRWMKVLPVAGGWREVLNLFASDHVPQMARWPSRFMILVIDLDDHPDRLTRVLEEIPNHLRNRVFVLGVLSEPERLKATLRQSLEEIGSELADDCRNSTDTTWGHDLLRHNAQELDRLREWLCPILFSAQ